MFHDSISKGFFHTLERLDQGDVLIVTRLDRLGCSTRDLLNTPSPFDPRKKGRAMKGPKASAPLYRGKRPLPHPRLQDGG